MLLLNLYNIIDIRCIEAGKDTNTDASRDIDFKIHAIMFNTVQHVPNDIKMLTVYSKIF